MYNDLYVSIYIFTLVLGGQVKLDENELAVLEISILAKKNVRVMADVVYLII